MTSEMQEILLYLSAFFMVFLSFVVFSFCLRVLLWIYVEYFATASPMSRVRDRRCPMRNQRDRQGNIFTIADDTQNSTGPHRCTDFFYVETNGDDAARIRAQLEKDDKDLPSYEEVMGLSAGNLCPMPPSTVIGASNASIATTDTMLIVPPYSEVDPNAITSATTTPAPRPAVAVVPVTSAAVPPPASAADDSPPPSTSRAAASNSTVALTIDNVVSNTSV